MSAQRHLHLSRTSIPHLERRVIRSRYDGVSRWADHTPIHPIRMPGYCVSFLSRVCIPHFKHRVIGCRNNGVSCWTDPHPITPIVCPSSEHHSFAMRASHTLSVWSSEADTMKSPTGLIAHPVTLFV